MRSFALSLGVAAIAVSIATPSLATAQRNVRRCSVNCGDYSLAVVSALLPSETAGVASDLVTLVIENRGTSSAPASVISVAPRNRLTLARRSSIPSLAPGQRTTLQLPVEIGPDGTQCISITISPVPAADPAAARFLAAAIPDPQVGSGDW